jgi:hypothetical protein
MSYAEGNEKCALNFAHEEKKTGGRPAWEDGPVITMDVKETRCKVMDWIRLLQDRVR